MTIRHVTDYLETIAPLHLQENYDNAGLIVGRPDSEVTGIMISLDAIESVVDDAIANGCNLIVSHHPIVFRGIKQFSEDNYVHRCIIKAIKHDISLYAIHTNLDNVLEGGVNQRIAQRLGLNDISILRPKDAALSSTMGSGAIGTLSSPMTEGVFLEHLKQAMSVEVIRHTHLSGRLVKRIAVCGGSGSFLLSTAISAGADCFVTADFKYHEFFDADGKLVICDIGHYESEQFTIQLLGELLRKNFPTFALHFTKIKTNPVSYF